MAPILGVPLMDRDHAAIEQMLVEAREKPDSELLNFFDQIARGKSAITSDERRRR